MEYHIIGVQKKEYHNGEFPQNTIYMWLNIRILYKLLGAFIMMC